MCSSVDRYHVTRRRLRVHDCPGCRSHGNVVGTRSRRCGNVFFPNVVAMTTDIVLITVSMVPMECPGCSSLGNVKCNEDFKYAEYSRHDDA